jgi:3-isopropylmalate/(R)-2-methylmalate dehydratase small subunit
VRTLISRSTANPEHQLTVSLEDQTVTDTDGISAHFDIDPFRKYCLLNGLDDIGLTLRHEHELDAFESKHDKAFWFLPENRKHRGAAGQPVAFDL